MATMNYNACLAFTLQQEGGYSNTPGDRGGPTKYGIDMATLIAWRGRRCTALDMSELTTGEAGEIYQRNFWIPVGGNELPEGIDLMIFDFGVNVGPQTSVMLTQKMLGLVDDGDVGPVTIGKLAAMPAPALINTLTLAQSNYYRNLQDFSQFGKGWLARCTRRQEAALAMVPAQAAQAQSTTAN